MVSSPQVDRRASLVSKILFIGFGLSIVFNFIFGNIFKTGYPFDTFFFRPEARYLDFYLPYSIASDPYKVVRSDLFNEMNPFSMPEIISGRAWEVNRLGPIYFPFAYWIVIPFTIFPFGTGLLLFWILTVFIFFAVCYKSLVTRSGLFNTFIITVFSYPLLVLLNRANFEIVIFVFIYLFSHYYHKNRLISPLFLAGAIAMKFLPLGYILVQLSDRKYKDVFISLGVAFFLNIFAYAIYPGGLINNIRAHLLNLQISSLFYALDGRNIAFNSSLSAGIKYLVLSFSSYPDLQLVGLQAESITRWGVIIILLVVSVLFLSGKLEYWEKITIVTCAILLLPSSTADYRLLLMYVPFFLWINNPYRARKDYVYSVLFGLLFIPKSYFHISAYPEVSISTLLNPLLMILIVLVIASDVITRAQIEKGMFFWSNYKYNALFVSSFFLLVTIISLFKFNRKENIDLNIIESLQVHAKKSENENDYLAAIGYYSQLILLEPTSPESRLGLGKSYLKVGRYWESYQEYKRALLFSDVNSAFYLEAETGIQIALRKTVCHMIKLNEFKWSNLIQEEYNELFPDFPKLRQNTCENG